MTRRPAATAIAAALLAGAGCSAHALLVADVSRPREAVIGEIQKEAPARGLTPTMPDAPVAADAAAKSDALTLSAGDRRVFYVRVVPRGAGARVVLEYEEDAPGPPRAEQAATDLLTSLAGAPPVRARTPDIDLNLDGDVSFDIRWGLGVGHLAGRDGAWFKSDLVMALGIPGSPPTAPTDAPGVRYRLAPVGGIGAVIVPGEGAGMGVGPRLEAGLALERRMLYRPLDETLETARRRRLELTGGAFWLPDQHRFGAEATASANLGLIGGVYVTGGHMWEPGGTVANYWLIGCRLSALSLLLILVSPYLLFGSVD